MAASMQQEAWKPYEYVCRALKDLCIDSVRVTEHELGRGAYGVIHAVEYNGARCAGKQLHPVFFHGTKSEHKRLLMERFVDECRFHSRQCHPNIVQLLGVHFQVGSILPMLVMELLDTSLHRFLEDHPNIPMAVKNSILLDISLGLLHLHTQMVVHRDLTATNVLLTKSLSAKITDLGMARIIDPRVVHAQYQHLTVVPGTQAVMAPEACTTNPVYNYKLDVFSFGALALQVHTQVFPVPDEALYRMDSSQPTGRITLTAIERRRSYIDLLEDTNEIQSLILHCLSDDPDMRPTTSSVVHNMKVITSLGPPPALSILQLVKKVNLLEEENTQLKAEVVEEQKKFSECMQQLKTKEEELHKQCVTVESLSKANTTLYQMLSSRIQLRDKSGRKQKRTEVSGVVRLGKHTPAAQARKHFTTYEQEEAREESFTSSEPQRTSLMSTSVQRNRQWKVWKVDGESLMDVTLMKTHQSLTSIIADDDTENSVQVSVETCSNLPVPLYKGQAVLLMGRVYIGGYQQGDDNYKIYPDIIYKYDPAVDNWEHYTRAPTGHFALAVFRNLLTTVGGVSPTTNLCSDCVHTFDRNQADWTLMKETMNHGRRGAVAVGFAAYLLVAGGVSDEGEMVDTLEIYYADTCQWHSILLSLPWSGKTYISTTFAQASWYLLLGGSDEGVDTSEVHPFPLTLLLDNLESSNTGTSPWKSLPTVVNSNSTVGFLNGHLITVGGRAPSQSSPSPLIHCLTDSEDHWVNVGSLPRGVEHAITLTLSKNSILVIGGLTSRNSNPPQPTARVHKVLVS